MEIKSTTPPALRPHGCWGACGQVFEGHRPWGRHVALTHILQPPEGLYNGCTSECSGLKREPPKPITDRSVFAAMSGEEP